MIDAVPTPVVTAVSGGFTDLTDLLVTTLIPALFALVLIGLGVRIAIKYLRRGSAS